MQDAKYLSDSLAAIGGEPLAGSGFETAEPEPAFISNEPAPAGIGASGEE